MSHISDSARRVAELLDRAAAAGVPPQELARWGRVLDPVALDLCGCRASLWALSVTAAFGLAVQGVLGFSLGRTGLCLTVAFFAAVAAKLARRGRAEALFRERLAALATVLKPGTSSRRP